LEHGCEGGWMVGWNEGRSSKHNNGNSFHHAESEPSRHAMELPSVRHTWHSVLI
jgi:hypothetical protein